MRASDTLTAYLISLIWILLVLFGFENSWLAASKKGPAAPIDAALPAQRAVQVISSSSAHSLYVALTQINRLPAHGIAGKATVLTVGCGQIDRPRLRPPFSWLVTTGFNRPHLCSLADIERAYGLPSKITLVSSAANPGQPSMALATYGPRAPRHLKPPPVHHPLGPTLGPPAVVAPDVPLAACAENTVLTIVAHEDDDLLFTNPDLAHDLNDGQCAVTVFLTAGDDGQSAAYWRARETGEQRAYNAMLHSSASWLHGQMQVGGETITVAEHPGAQRVYLLFLRLPDGNLSGQGFARSGNVSLLKLQQGSIASLRSLDGRARYTAPQLTNVLLVLMQLVQPTVIRTQSYLDGPLKGDHSDHQVTAQLVRQAYRQLQAQNPGITMPIRFYSGYTIKGLPSNLSDTDTLAKQAFFLVYAKSDQFICRNASSCDTTAYDGYFSREYSYGINDQAPAPAATFPIPEPSAQPDTGAPPDTTTPSP